MSGPGLPGANEQRVRPAGGKKTVRRPPFPLHYFEKEGIVSDIPTALTCFFKKGGGGGKE